VAFYTHLAKFTILTSFEKHFKILDEIGRGAFAKVYNGLNVISKKVVALKVFNKQHISSTDHGTAIIYNEITNLQKLREFKLSPLIGVYETEESVIIVQQKAAAGNMMNYLRLHAENYNEDLIKNLIFKILHNLKELHSAGFIHRDIKPENILFHNYSLKSALFLGDFGCSVMKKDCGSSGVARICSGTLGFVAPEIIRNNSYDEKCDLFSLGSLFYCRLTG
jgi:calcium/calmodulin-dependent protein kinase I